MSYKEITAGQKKAKPTAARFIRAKTGTLGMEIAFNFEEPATGLTETLNYQCWLSPKAAEFSMDLLVNVLGFSGNDSADENGVLTDPNALAWDNEVSLVVELQEYESKYYPKIKYVNKIGGSSFGNCQPEVNKSELQAINFKGLFLAAKQMQANDQKVPF